MHGNPMIIICLCEGPNCGGWGYQNPLTSQIEETFDLCGHMRSSRKVPREKQARSASVFDVAASSEGNEHLTL